jgi:hypothetical protein
MPPKKKVERGAQENIQVSAIHDCHKKENAF